MRTSQLEDNKWGDHDDGYVEEDYFEDIAALLGLIGILALSLSVYCDDLIAKDDHNVDKKCN